MNYASFRISILCALGLSACATRGDLDELGEDSSGSATTGDGDGDGDTPTPIDPTLCDDPQPIMQTGTDVPSGFVRCADGFVHRVEAVACETPALTGTCSTPNPDFGCTSDADCDAIPHGSCHNDWDRAACECHYGCETDADCGPGGICACAGVMGEISHCVPASCSVSDACDGGLCGLGTYEDECWALQVHLACTTEDATCRLNSDCGDTLCDNNNTRPLSCMAQDGWHCQAPETVDCVGQCGD